MRSARPPGPAATIASATCSGFPTIQRVAGLRLSDSCGNPSVDTKPGSTRPTWTPFERSSGWSESVHPISAAFEAPYEPAVDRATLPAIDATFTIELGADAPRRGRNTPGGGHGA